MSRYVVVGLIIALCMTGCVDPGEGSAIDDPIEVFGPYRNNDADRFADVLAGFRDETGIEVRYVGGSDFVKDLVSRAGEANDPPDIAVIPQPGLIREFADDGSIVELEPEVLEAIDENHLPEVAAFGEVDGTPYAVPFRASIKSLVWYQPSVFAENGWAIPQSWVELVALVDAVRADPDLTPWCFGMEAGSATGWAATDWTEEILVRSAGIDLYEKWAAGELDFADPSVEAAFDEFRSLVLDPGRTLGGVGAVIATAVDEAILPLLGDEPGCAMYMQAEFAAGWLPADTEIGPDGGVDFFVLPGDDPADGPPVMVGGDQLVAFNTDERVTELLTFLSGPEAAEIWVRQGGFISPASTVSQDAYPDRHLSALARELGDASIVVFDASDQMPPAIGSGLLWTEITDWVAGTIEYDRFARSIDEARGELD
jgi:alpha-glucoside transport system substrate-binding protein